MTFENWMEAIDATCSEEFGLSIHDLPDMCFRDGFDCGQSPSDFMRENLPDIDALRDHILG